MQAASSPYLPPPPQPYYHNLYHIQPLAPQDHDLKRQYLALLPPQQIIEICLTFDVHVPPYIKSTIWPQDLHSAIANLRKPTTNGDASASASSQKENDKPPEPVMASLERPLDEPSNPQPSSSSIVVPAAEPQPPDKPAENAAPTTTPAPPTPVPAPAPVPATPVAPPAPQQPPYPHQPYGYPQHPPAAYPHAPYYPPPPGYPSYPSTYPHYPPPVPNGYSHSPHPPPPPPHPPYPPPPNPVYPTTHAPQPPAHPEQGSDDLPSYEEMIVEALQESNDPEGCAPKDLFAWMAARYPLQSNFRPSASQALQKAFKRGRLEKSNNGKYRLSATWEGGNTSRRTTRRPQTQTQQTSALGSSASPFTHVPLVHHHQQHQQNAHSPPYPGQPFPYPYGSTAPGYPGYPPPQTLPQAQAQPPQATQSEAAKTTTTSTADKSATGLDPASDVDRDAYEAAQNILKAINFGDLFQIASEGGADGKKADDVSVDQLTSLLVQAQNAMSAQMDAAPHVASSQPAVLLPTLSANAGVAVAVPTVSEPPTNVRAELQAQLVLLAAQLAELSQENEENIGPSGDQPQVAPPLPTPAILQQPQSVEVNHQTQPSMTFDPPFMDALLPPPSFSLPEPQAQIQQQSPPTTSSQRQPETQPQPQPQPPQSPHLTPHHQEDDVPIDPVLQGLANVDGPVSPVPAQAINSAQPSSIDHTMTVEALPSASAPRSTTPLVASQQQSPPPPPPLRPIFAVPDTMPGSVVSTSVPPHAPEPLHEPEAEQHTTTPNFVDGETDSDDDDMEEIA